MSVDILRQAAAQMENDARRAGDDAEFLRAVSDWLQSEVGQWVENFSMAQLPPEGDPFGAARFADRCAQHALAVAYAYLTHS